MIGEPICSLINLGVELKEKLLQRGNKTNNDNPQTFLNSIDEGICYINRSILLKKDDTLPITIGLC